MAHLSNVGSVGAILQAAPVATEIRDIRAAWLASNILGVPAIRPGTGISDTGKFGNFIGISVW